MFTYLIIATIKKVPTRVERLAASHAAALAWAHTAFGKRNVQDCKLKTA